MCGKKMTQNLTKNARQKSVAASMTHVNLQSISVIKKNTRNALHENLLKMVELWEKISEQREGR